MKRTAYSRCRYIFDRFIRHMQASGQLKLTHISAHDDDDDRSFRGQLVAVVRCYMRIVSICSINGGGGGGGGR